MSKLNIPVEAEGADEEFVVGPDEGFAAPAPLTPAAPAPTNPMDSPEALKHKRFIMLLTTALENPAGIRIKRPTHGEAVSLRHRLYRARMWYRSVGFTSLEKLIIRIESKGFSHYVYIQPETPLELELL